MAMFQSGASCLLASILTVLLFSAMQLYKPVMAMSPLLGGFTGSWVFVFALTAVGNLEKMVLGKNSQAKMFPEVTFCLLLALIGSSLVHRICVTSCLMFSLLNLYFLHSISQKTYTVQEKASFVPTHTNKKKNR